MKLHRLVVGFIVLSSITVLVAGAWFKAPAIPAPAAATAVTTAPALSPAALAANR